MPGDEGWAEPSPAEPNPAPVTPDTGRSRSLVPLIGTPAHAEAEPGRSLAVAWGRLARLVPGRGLRTRARQDAEFEAAAREAYRSALRLESGAPLVPAPPAPRSAAAPTPEPSPAPVATPATVPAPQGGLVAKPATRPTTPTTASASAPTTPGAASATALDAAAAASSASAWATPPRHPAEQSATPDRVPEAVSPAPPRRRQPGDTAPDFLLRAPTSVSPKADDFFDGLVQQVERDR
jgi:hypothetical protein